MAENKLVQFVTGTSAEFAIADKDPNTLYFITDERRIYKGDTPYGSVRIEIREVLPDGVTDIPEVGVFYLNASDGEVRFYNGSSYMTIVPPIAHTLDENATTEQLATAKNVYEFVKAEIAKVDAGGIVDTIDALDERIEDIETAVLGKADAATTLEGYGITDAYTKTETDTAIATAVADAGHLKYKIVENKEALDTLEPRKNIIALVPKGTHESNQYYDEYMWVEGPEIWELIGDTAVSLDGYATEAYVDSAIETANESAASDIEEAKEAAIQEAKDYADGLAEGYATAAQGALADSAVQRIAEGTINGTIDYFIGEDPTPTVVEVHGLKSAAYTDTTDYDAAGAADTALAAAKKYTNDEIVKALSWQEL